MKKSILFFSILVSGLGSPLAKAETEAEQHMREMREDMAQRRKEVHEDIVAARNYYLKHEWLTAVAKDLETYRSDTNSNSNAAANITINSTHK